MDEWEQLQNKLEELSPYIGRLVIEFTALEETLNSMLVETINEHDEDSGWVIIARMSYTTKTNLFYDLNRRILEFCNAPIDFIIEFDTVIEDIRKAGRIRNEIIHAAWYELNPSDSKVKTRTQVKKGELSHIQKQLTTTEIEDAINFINNVEDHLDNFWEKRERFAC